MKLIDERRTTTFRGVSAAFILVLIVAFGPAMNAFAGSGASSSPQSPTSSFFGVGLLLVYLTRRREIGGWLFYYYLQLYMSLAMTVLFTAMSIQNVAPSRWDRTDLYAWFLLSWALPILAQCIEVVAATYLLIRKSEQNLNLLRKGILALLITTGIALAIDIKFFSDDPSAAAMDGMVLVFSCIWLAYFYQSVRVRRVFIERNWVHDDSSSVVRTPQERRYMRNRALLWAAALYLGGFLLCAIGQGEKKPDPAFLFGVPLVYSGLAALISYACPISKKRRTVLLDIAPSTQTGRT